MNRIIFMIVSVLAIGAAPAGAQLVAASNEPIDITGDTAEFHNNVTVWTGNVRIVQGEGILTADRLEATITDEGAFESLVATGSIRYSNGSESITGDRADYDEQARAITITDNVIVTQGKQVMSAGAVTYWIDSGKVKFKPAAGKRIRGIFYTEKDEQT